MAIILMVISLLGLVTNPITHTQAGYLYHICANTNFAPNSTYQKNLDTLLASLPSYAADPKTNGFGNYNVSRSGTEASYGQFLCSGDLSKEKCQDCVKNATQEVVQNCPNQKTSIIWYDECTLRYSNKSFFLRSDTEPSLAFYNTQNVSDDTERFTRLVNDTLKGLVTKIAANGGISGKMFEVAKVNFTSSDTLYAFAQCIPVLSNKNCSSCLMQNIEGLATCCSTSKGGRVLNPSCNVRFDLYPFYNTSILSSQAPEPAPGPVPFPSPPVEAPDQYPPAPGEAPVQYPPAPGEAPVQHPPAPSAEPVSAPRPGSPNEAPPPPVSDDNPSAVAPTPGTGPNGNNKKSSSTFVTIATTTVAFIVLFSFKF